MRPPDFFTANYNLVPHTSRPDFLLPKWDRLSELNSFTGSTGHPGSKPGFGHRHHHRQTELGQHVAGQAAVQPETQVPPKIEGVEAIDSPLMAAVFFSTLANNEFVKKNGPRLVVIALALALTTCLPQSQSAPGPESPPAVTVVTNTPVFIDAPTATLSATPTETPFFGAGGPVFTADIGLQLEQLADANLPLPVCDQSANQSADSRIWDSPEATAIVEARGDVQNLYSLLRPKLPAGAQVRLCVNSEGWYFRVTTADGAPAWNQIKGDDGQWRWADHPNQIPVDENGNIGQWRMMRLPGPSSDFAPLVIGGVPAEVQLDKDGQPTAYFDPLTGEWVSLKPEPTPTASAIPTITNTPRPTAIPATAIPKPSPTFTLVPLPTAKLQPEGFVSTWNILPSREELIGCATGVKLSSREVDAIAPTTGKPFHYYRNKVTSNSGGVLTFDDGRVEDINRFVATKIIQVMIDEPMNNNKWMLFENPYLIVDFAQLIKPGDYTSLTWENGAPISIALFCNAR